jgi:hypothetical protein
MSLESWQVVYKENEKSRLEAIWAIGCSSLSISSAI